MARHEAEERSDGLIEKMIAVNRVTKGCKGWAHYGLLCFNRSWRWRWQNWYG